VSNVIHHYGTEKRSLTGKRHTECCHPTCRAEPWPDAPMPICGHHYAALIRHYQQMMQDHRGDHARAILDVVTVQQAQVTGTPQVYFIRFGQRVKIGFSANVRERLKALPHESVLKVIPGAPADERRWHAQWQHLRVTGEWFELTDELMSAIDNAGPDIHPRTRLRSR